MGYMGKGIGEIGMGCMGKGMGEMGKVCMGKVCMGKVCMGKVCNTPAGVTVRLGQRGSRVWKERFCPTVFSLTR